MPFGNIDRIKDEFPIFGNNPNLVYLDNAASTQKPEMVLNAMDSYYRRNNANVHRSVHTLGERATQALEDARRTAAEYLNASPREIVFTRGTTEGLNLLAWTLTELLVSPGDIILTTELEHHSNFVPWQQAAIRKGAELLLLPLRPDATLNLDVLSKLEQDGRADKVRIAAVSHVSNAFGTVQPVRFLADWCRQRDIPLVVDAAQSVPHLAMDVSSLGADFLVFSGHKIYGPMGSGVLWGRENWLERMPPWQTGGEMISMVRTDKTTWNELPYKFEAGTPDVAAAVGLASALDWIKGIGMKNLVKHENALEDYTADQLSQIDGLDIYGPADHTVRRGVFSFNAYGLHSHDAAHYLNTQGVAVRSGHHCAQPAMRVLGIPSTARASLAVYNTKSDIDRLADALKSMREYFKVL